MRYRYGCTPKRAKLEGLAPAPALPPNADCMTCNGKTEGLEVYYLDLPLHITGLALS